MMRVKNEERWIEKSVTSLLRVCSSVLVMDDHSTDSTVEVLSRIPNVIVFNSPFDTLDESRDKTYMLNTHMFEALSLFPSSWVICIDGDEELCVSDPEAFKQQTLKNEDRVVSYAFQIVTLYDSPEQMRVDPPYNEMFRPSMFKIIRPGMVFKSSAQHGGGFHCSNVPADIGFGVTLHQPEPVRLRHYGYMRKEDRERKYEFYVKHDPGHADWYRKECYGEPTVARLPEDLR